MHAVAKPIGVISDTHGLLRPEALLKLEGCSRIIHAGDLGGPDILPRLQQIAPVDVVRGNVDYGRWAEPLPLTEVVDIGGRLIFLLHNLEHLDLDPVAAGFEMVISGHTHRPKIETRDGVIYFNPGSAGPRRFQLPISIARLTVTEDGLVPELFTLG